MDYAIRHRGDAYKQGLISGIFDVKIKVPVNCQMPHQKGANCHIKQNGLCGLYDKIVNKSAETQNIY